MPRFVVILGVTETCALAADTAWSRHTASEADRHTRAIARCCSFTFLTSFRSADHAVMNPRLSRVPAPLRGAPGDSGRRGGAGGERRGGLRVAPHPGNESPPLPRTTRRGHASADRPDGSALKTGRDACCRQREI